MKLTGSLLILGLLLTEIYGVIVTKVEEVDVAKGGNHMGSDSLSTPIL